MCSAKSSRRSRPHNSDDKTEVSDIQRKGLQLIDIIIATERLRKSETKENRSKSFPRIISS
jgi:hypothetical protein